MHRPRSSRQVKSTGQGAMDRENATAAVPPPSTPASITAIITTCFFVMGHLIRGVYQPTEAGTLTRPRVNSLCQQVKTSSPWVNRFRTGVHSIEASTDVESALTAIRILLTAEQRKEKEGLA